MELSDDKIYNDLRIAYCLCGVQPLVIFSKRQDIGIQKCEWGVEKGFLRKEIIEIDEQETNWHYYFTDKAKEEFSK